MGNMLAMHGQRDEFRFVLYFLSKSLKSGGNMLAMRWQHVGNVLATHCQHVGNALAMLLTPKKVCYFPLTMRGQHVYNALATRWLCVGNTLATCYQHVVNALATLTPKMFF